MPIAQINGININYRVEGRGYPLVMIMGFSGTLAAWGFQIPTFKKHFLTVTFDNSGAGKSDKPPGSYSMRAMADDTIGLMDYIGIEKAHVLGVSMGGMIAQELAINYPERTNRLVLGCTFACMDEYSGIAPELYQSMGFDETDSNIDTASVPIKEAADALVRLAFNKSIYRIILSTLIRFGYGFKATSGFWGQTSAILHHDTLDRLHLIKAPTLVITGTKDRIIKPSSSEVLARSISGAKLMKVEGGSHAFIIEERGIFNREVLNFLGVN